MKINIKKKIKKVKDATDGSDIEYMEYEISCKPLNDFTKPVPETEIEYLDLTDGEKKTLYSEASKFRNIMFTLRKRLSDEKSICFLTSFSLPSCVLPSLIISAHFVKDKDSSWIEAEQIIDNLIKEIAAPL